MLRDHGSDIMSGWTDEDIFFDDEDMPYEEVMWNTFLWYGEAFNPLSFVTDPTGKFTPRGVVQTAVAGGIVTSAAWLVSGPMSTMSGQGPNFGRMLALKADSYSKFGRYGSHLGSIAWRSAAFGIRNAGFIGATLAALSVVASPDDNWFLDYVLAPIVEFSIPGLDDFTFGEES